MLTCDRTALVLIDVQEKLFALMQDREALLDQLIRLVAGCRELGIPVFWAEQNPAALGPTVPELRTALEGLTPVSKLSFSVCGCAEFQHALQTSGRNQFLVAGIETHVCVYQSCMDLAAAGHEVQVVADAVSSRTASNRSIGLERCRVAGATWTSVETALFELLRRAEGPAFKALLKVIK